MGRLAAADQAVFDKNLAAVKAVIEFNDAHGITYSRMKLYNYFKISKTIISKLGLSSTTFHQTVKKNASETEVPNLKRERPDDESAEQLTSTPPATPQPQRRNPVRNDGRDRKRLKLMLESLGAIDSPPNTPIAASSQYSASAPSSEQLLTPPSTKSPERKKRLDSQAEHQIDQISQDIKLEPTGFDDGDIESESSARAPLAPSQLQRHLQSQIQPIVIN